jgi:hypothetical protein
MALTAMKYADMFLLSHIHTLENSVIVENPQSQDSDKFIPSLHS